MLKVGLDEVMVSFPDNGTPILHIFCLDRFYTVFCLIPLYDD